MKASPTDKPAERRPIAASHRRSPPVARRIDASTADGQRHLVGGPGIKPAKHALDDSFEHLSPLQKLLLARQLGYDSFTSLLAASTVVTLSDGSAWWLTADRFGGWTAWNLCAIGAPQSTRIDDEGLAAGRNGG